MSMPVRRFDHDLFILEYAAGKTATDIAAENGCSAPTVITILKRKGVWRPKVVEHVDRAEVVRRHKAGEPTVEIAEALNCHRCTVRKITRAAGLHPLRRVDRVLQRQAVALRRTGLTAREIGDRLSIHRQRVSYLLGQAGIEWRVIPRREPITAKKVTQARVLLETTDLTWAEIGLKVGAHFEGLRYHLKGVPRPFSTTKRRAHLRDGLEEAMLAKRRQGWSWPAIGRAFGQSELLAAKRVKAYCAAKGLPLPVYAHAIDVDHITRLRHTGKSWAEIAETSKFEIASLRKAYRRHMASLASLREAA